MKEVTKEQVEKDWLNFVNHCESENLDYVMSGLPTIERMVKDANQSKLMKYLKGYDKFYDEYILQIMIDIELKEQLLLNSLYSTYLIDSVLSNQSTLSDEKRAERDAYFTE